MSKTGEDVMGIIQASASEQAANADQLAAEALTQRTSEDQALIAQQRHEVAMAEIQHQQNVELAKMENANARKMMLLDHRLTTEGLDSTNKKMVGNAVQNLAQVGALIVEMRKSGATTEEISAAVYGLPQFQELSDSEARAIQRMLTKLLNDDVENAPDDAQAEIVSILRGFPGWENLGQGKKDHLKDYVSRQLQIEQTGLLIGSEAAPASAKSGKFDMTYHADNGVGVDPYAQAAGYNNYRAAVVKTAEKGRIDPEEERDTVIRWVRSQLHAKLRGTMGKNVADARIAEFADAVVDGVGGLTGQGMPGNLTERDKAAIRSVFAALPEDKRKYFDYWDTF
jgi:hypothetical protein